MKNDKEQLELKRFTFDLIGDGQKVFCGEFNVPDLERGVNEARKLCKRLTLPGWELLCRETGSTFPAVQFRNPNGTKQYA